MPIRVRASARYSASIANGASVPSTSTGIALTVVIDDLTHDGGSRVTSLTGHVHERAARASGVPEISAVPGAGLRPRCVPRRDAGCDAALHDHQMTGRAREAESAVRWSIGQYDG